MPPSPLLASLAVPMSAAEQTGQVAASAVRGEGGMPASSEVTPFPQVLQDHINNLSKNPQHTENKKSNRTDTSVQLIGQGTAAAPLPNALALSSAEPEAAALALLGLLSLPDAVPGTGSPLSEVDGNTLPNTRQAAVTPEQERDELAMLDPGPTGVVPGWPAVSAPLMQKDGVVPQLPAGLGLSPAEDAESPASPLLAPVPQGLPPSVDVIRAVPPSDASAAPQEGPTSDVARESAAIAGGMQSASTVAMSSLTTHQGASPETLFHAGVADLPLRDGARFTGAEAPVRDARAQDASAILPGSATAGASRAGAAESPARTPLGGSVQPPVDRTVEPYSPRAVLAATGVDGAQGAYPGVRLDVVAGGLPGQVVSAATVSAAPVTRDPMAMGTVPEGGALRLPEPFSQQATDQALSGGGGAGVSTGSAPGLQLNPESTSSAHARVQSADSASQASQASVQLRSAATELAQGVAMPASLRAAALSDGSMRVSGSFVSLPDPTPEADLISYTRASLTASASSTLTEAQVRSLQPEVGGATAAMPLASPGARVSLSEAGAPDDGLVPGGDGRTALAAANPLLLERAAAEAELAATRPPHRNVAAPTAPVAGLAGLPPAPAGDAVPSSVLMSEDAGREGRPAGTIGQLLPEALVALSQAVTPDMRSSAGDGAFSASLSSAVTRGADAQAPAPSVPQTPGSLPVLLGAATGRLGEELGQRILWLSGHNLRSAEIQLDPVELGPMQVQVHSHRDGTSIQFTTHSAAVKDAIETHLPRLRELLEGSGLNLLDVNVAQQQQRGAQGEREAFAGSSPSSRGRLAAIGQAGEPAAPARRSLGLVDDYA